MPESDLKTITKNILGKDRYYFKVIFSYFRNVESKTNSSEDTLAAKDKGEFLNCF